jgi:cytochrome c-type biogenesis protein CcmH
MRLTRNTAIVVWTLILAVGAAPAQAPPHLTPEQEALARRLEGMLIAPCCFVSTVAEHRSPLSDKVREEVRAMVAGGATETEVLDAFVAKYGERILAAPTAQGFNLFAYVLPVVFIVAGLIVIVVVMRRHGPQAPSAQPPSEIPDRIKDRFSAELAHFDE